MVQNPPFYNQVPIITAVGIDFEVTKQLASQGARIILNDVDKDLANASALQIRKNRGRYLWGFCKEDFLNYQPESKQKLFQVNLFDTFFLTQAATKQMI
jgi:glucose 1-dehydrogenase